MWEIMASKLGKKMSFRFARTFNNLATMVQRPKNKVEKSARMFSKFLPFQLVNKSGDVSCGQPMFTSGRFRKGIDVSVPTEEKSAYFAIRIPGTVIN